MSNFAIFMWARFSLFARAIFHKYSRIYYFYYHHISRREDPWANLWLHFRTLFRGSAKQKKKPRTTSPLQKHIRNRLAISLPCFTRKTQHKVDPSAKAGWKTTTAAVTHSSRGGIICFKAINFGTRECPPAVSANGDPWAEWSLGTHVGGRVRVLILD